MVRAIRIPDQNNPKRKYGFVEFDDFDAVDIAIGQGEHKIEGHRVRVELALPQMNDSLYEQARLCVIDSKNECEYIPRLRILMYLHA